MVLLWGCLVAVGVILVLLGICGVGLAARPPDSDGEPDRGGCIPALLVAALVAAIAMVLFMRWTVG